MNGDESLKKEKGSGDGLKNLKDAKEEPRNSPEQNDEPCCSRSTLPSFSSEEQDLLGQQTEFLLSSFIEDRARQDCNPASKRICDAHTSYRQSLKKSQKMPLGLGFSDESLSDIAITLRGIGDEISQDVNLNNLIDSIPLESTRDIFWKVCGQIFEDGSFNWGRIVTVFYFAYRLLCRMINAGLDAYPWFTSIISWAASFIVRHVGRWISARGGWTMIREVLGRNTLVFSALSGLSVAMLVYYIFNPQK